MAEVDAKGLEEISDRFDRLLKEYPSLKRETLEALGRRMLFEVVWGIGPSDKVQYWQGYYIGAKNGYVAVRPKDDTWQLTKSGNRYSAAEVTGAIERGHANRRSKTSGVANGQSKRSSTPGKHFYSGARAALEEIATPLVRQLVEEVAARLEGKK